MLLCDGLVEDPVLHPGSEDVAQIALWGGGLVYDMLGSYDRAVQFTVLIGFIAGFAQLLMDDKPSERMTAATLAPAE